jgi:hypothetical protein
MIMEVTMKPVFSEAPNPKSQISRKLQIPNPKQLAVEDVGISV